MFSFHRIIDIGVLKTLQLKPEHTGVPFEASGKEPWLCPSGQSQPVLDIMGYMSLIINKQTMEFVFRPEN